MTRVEVVSNDILAWLIGIERLSGFFGEIGTV